MQVPQGATTVRIPRQRGSKAGAPVVVVLTEPRPSLSSRIARAVGVWAWKHRAAWAPTGYAVLVYVLAAVAHATAPWMAFVVAPATAGPLLGLWWAAVRAADRIDVRSWRLRTAVALATVAILWAAAAVRYDPLVVQLTWPWVVLTALVQVFWLVIRRSK
ncbi:hypothetical protein CP979_11115 [Streptomyces filamentosus]|nr:hypothetical protein CP979_11115 [Streptomyces filamentosus]